LLLIAAAGSSLHLLGLLKLMKKLLMIEMVKKFLLSLGKRLRLAGLLWRVSASL
jgi:hypothetical protein